MKYIQEAFDENWIAPLGPNVNGLEQDLEHFLDEKGIYVAALSSGRLRADPSLVIEAPVEEVGPIEEETTDTAAAVATDDGDAIAAPAAPSSITVTVQFDTPDAESVSATERAVAAIDGVGAATTSSLALGGTSVMRVTYRGDLEALKSALSARGFAVQEGGGALRISR